MSFFLGAGLLDYQAKLAGQTLNPLVEGLLPDWLIYIGCFIWCYLNCGYFATAFYLLSFENFHKVYASMNYCLHITLGLAIVICLLLPKHKKKAAVEPVDKADEKKSKKDD